MENKAGRLAELTEVLSEIDIKIRAMILADISEFGVLRMIVSDSDRAKQVLKNQGFAVSVATVSAVEIKNEFHDIHDIMEEINKSRINVEYMYAYSQEKKDTTMVVFMVDDPDKTASIIEQFQQKQD